VPETSYLQDSTLAEVTGIPRTVGQSEILTIPEGYRVAINAWQNDFIARLVKEAMVWK